MSPARRRQVFDPNRLGDIDDLLPPPPAASEPLAAPSPAEPPAEPDSLVVAPPARSAPPSESTRAPEPAPAGAPPPRQPRGQGGRPVARRGPERAPAEEEASGTRRVPVAVRIPPTLYSAVNKDLLSGPERPSYGQLVIWTCEDYPDDVVRGIQEARPSPGARRPRGHTLASEGVQITLRLTLQERGYLDQIAEQALPAPHAKAVTRTEVATAALRLALTTQSR